MPEYENLPILFAIDAAGVLRHVDEVPNGLACGCTCPDPKCGQELVAKNAGEKRVHHFAHRRGSCKWSVENVLLTLALGVVRSAERMAFPALDYRDAMTNRNVVLSPARTLRVSSASLESLSGRGAPELVVTCSASGAKKQVAVVVSLLHPLKERELEAIASTGIDVVLVDLRASLRARKRAEGKHFDRVAIVASYQDKRYIERLLLDESCPFKSWASNSKRASAEAESAKRMRAWQAEQDKIEAERRRREQERERAEAERREILKQQLAEQRAAEEAEAARRRAILEAEEAQRLAEEKAAAEEAERLSRIDIMEQVCQQERQARDPAGRRWVKCEKCGKVKPVDEFMMYGGAGRINLGTCYDCGRE